MRAGRNSGFTVLVAVLAMPAGVPAQGGARWTVEPSTSLVWWQIDPHYEHLWATTCPDDPSWQPGEGRSPQYFTDYRNRPRTIPSGRSDPRIPLFPRHRVRPLCRQAVRGEVTADDTLRWTGVRGVISAAADSLITGLDIRDAYARRVVLETKDHPELTFTIDSLVDVRAGDTLRATAIGRFQVHGYSHPVRVPLLVTREPAGLRVRGQFAFDAQMLVSHFRMSAWALGMGVGFRRWKTVHCGADLILVAPR